MSELLTVCGLWKNAPDKKARLSGSLKAVKTHEKNCDINDLKNFIRSLGAGDDINVMIFPNTHKTSPDSKAPDYNLVFGKFPKREREPGEDDGF